MKNSYNNANMWHKSMIQHVFETNTLIDTFKASLNQILESYTVKDNVFGIVNNTPCEINSGYFVAECEKDNLQDAIKEMNCDITKAIRISEGKFSVGSIYKSVFDCPNNSTIYDIECQNTFSI